MVGERVGFGHGLDEVGLRVQRIEEQEGKDERARSGEGVRAEVDDGVFERRGRRGGSDRDPSREQSGPEGLLFPESAGFVPRPLLLACGECGRLRVDFREKRAEGWGVGGETQANVAGIQCFG